MKQDLGQVVPSPKEKEVESQEEDPHNQVGELRGVVSTYEEQLRELIQSNAKMALECRNAVKLAAEAQEKANYLQEKLEIQMEISQKMSNQNEQLDGMSKVIS